MTCRIPSLGHTATWYGSRDHLKAVTSHDMVAYVVFRGGVALGNGVDCHQSMGNHCWELWIHYDIDCASCILWRLMCCMILGALLQRRSLICVISSCLSLSRGQLLLVVVTIGYSRVFFVYCSACWGHKGWWITSDRPAFQSLSIFMWP